MQVDPSTTPGRSDDLIYAAVNGTAPPAVSGTASSPAGPAQNGNFFESGFGNLFGIVLGGWSANRISDNLGLGDTATQVATATGAIKGPDMFSGMMNWFGSLGSGGHAATVEAGPNTGVPAPSQEGGIFSKIGGALGSFFSNDSVQRMGIAYGSYRLADRLDLGDTGRFMAGLAGYEYGDRIGGAGRDFGEPGGINPIALINGGNQITGGGGPLASIFNPRSGYEIHSGPSDMRMANQVIQYNLHHGVSGETAYQAGAEAGRAAAYNPFT